jgi:hypothetical protein
MALFGRETEQDKQRAQDYARWLQAQNPWAIASLVLGIFSLIEFGVLGVFGIGSIAAGIVALRQLSRVRAEGMIVNVQDATSPLRSSTRSEPIDYSDGSAPSPSIMVIDYERAPQVSVARTRGRGLAWGGIVTGAISLILAIVLYTRLLG